MKNRDSRPGRIILGAGLALLAFPAAQTAQASQNRDPAQRLAERLDAVRAKFVLEVDGKAATDVPHLLLAQWNKCPNKRC